ncbi:hypothetical protein G7043_22030 [Lentzea sp. NEAU-D13]|uniref:Uncharacterized protein n=1 Tax=Lentzea alba TaxID=2714351 RepID=A0A7C9RRM8_9PSEU|nr:hypothetical protein [Lentzea alba]NGY61611.1 hypothetical protein [Lentzea alba]
MDGEYFRGAYCPRDGHSSETSIEVARLIALMREKGIVPSLEELVSHGFDGPLSDVVIIQFASSENMPNWLVPF